jgi:hypothetical protein
VPSGLEHGLALRVVDALAGEDGGGPIEEVPPPRELTNLARTVPINLSTSSFVMPSRAMTI